MLLRSNSLLWGHSAVRMKVINLLIKSLNRGIPPLNTLRGSISASGDLSPLSHIGGLLEDNPAVFVQVRSKDLDAESKSSQQQMHFIR
jgi:phenylalanine ammonia-lyase